MNSLSRSQFSSGCIYFDFIVAWLFDIILISLPCTCISWQKVQQNMLKCRSTYMCKHSPWFVLVSCSRMSVTTTMSSVNDMTCLVWNNYDSSCVNDTSCPMQMIPFFSCKFSLYTRKTPFYYSRSFVCVKL